MMNQDTESEVLQELIALMSKLNGEKLSSSSADLLAADAPNEPGQEELAMEPMTGDQPAVDPKDEKLAQMIKALKGGESPESEEEDEDGEGDSVLKRKGQIF